MVGASAIEKLRVRLLVGALQVDSAIRPSRIVKSSTSLLAGVKAEHVHLCLVAGNTV